MFKNFFILALTVIFGSGGCLPYVPVLVTSVQENYYSSTDIFTNYDSTDQELIEETITYDSYVTTIANVDILCPKYGSSYSTNGCVPTAGSIMTAYYDYYFNNLLPDYEPTYIYNNKLYWQPQNSTINNLQITLHNLMGTNAVQAGTTVAQFKSGMTSYYNGQGYGITFNNVTSSINATNVKNYFNLEKPIVLFLNSYDYYPSMAVDLTDTEMTMLGYHADQPHAVVAFACIEYEFYKDNTLFRTDKYLYVTYGDSTYGYLSISGDTSYIEEAYTFNIITAV